MRVGILTFVRTLNYGASLQGYALARAVAALGHDAELVDYECLAVSRREFPWTNRALLARPKAFVRYLLERKALREKARRFAAFESSHVPIGPSPYTSENVASASSRYDIFVTGSDQIWSLTLTGGDRTFFLDFEPDGDKKVAYAASLGSETLDGPGREGIAQLLQQYRAIGVREESGRRIVQSVSGRGDVLRTLDPVLLLSADDWRGSFTSAPGRPYVLLYFLFNRTACVRAALEMASARGLEVVLLGERPYPDRRVRWIPAAGPDEFVSLIRDASAVMTGSFHATVFATLFNRPFYCDLPEGNARRRIEDFLALTRSPFGAPPEEWTEDVDVAAEWAEANAALQQERDASLAFLRSSLMIPGA